MNVIEVQNVSKNFKHFSLNNVSFSIKRGFITGLIGPNGAGKSTLIKMMLGLVRPDSGHISVFGSDVFTDEAAVKQRIGIVFDESHFYEDLTIYEMKRIVAPFYQRWNDQKFAGYLDTFELSPKQKIKELSKGMKMKFSLALALSHEAELLIMDEPTAGLDPVFRRELLEQLGSIILDEGNAILFSTHITTDLDRIADYITFINKGQLVFSEDKDAIVEQYALVKGERELLDRDTRKQFVGIRETSVGFEGLVNNRAEAQAAFGGYAVFEKPTLEDIMFYTVKGGTAHV